MRPTRWSEMRLSARALATIGGATASVAHGGVAYAQPSSFLLGRPVGGWSPAGRIPAGATGGPFLAVEGGWSATLSSANGPAEGGVSFGARAGWEFPNGLSAHARYDYLGVNLAPSSSPLELATVGLRYTVPVSIPLPFAEVGAGTAFVGGDARFAASAGLGASIPLAAYVLLDVVGRDWLVPIWGELRQTLTVGLGLTVTFAGPAH